MLPWLLWLVLAPGTQSGQTAPPANASPQAAPPRQESRAGGNLLELLSVRRVYVDRLSGGDTAVQIRDMILSSLHSAGLFVLTENPERADAFLRGSAEDLVFTDTHSTSEGLNARGAVSTGSGSSRDVASRRAAASIGVGQQETARIEERRHEASAAVRLVNKEGDVIWATTQESMGGKFRGASADVADKITRQLIRDFEQARKWREEAQRRSREGAGNNAAR
ncbi:MAG: hypothetical protein ACE141_19355 [Bryobacteraceae bacterium]